MPRVVFVIGEHSISRAKSGGAVAVRPLDTSRDVFI